MTPGHSYLRRTAIMPGIFLLVLLGSACSDQEAGGQASEAAGASTPVAGAPQAPVMSDIERQLRRQAIEDQLGTLLEDPATRAEATSLGKTLRQCLDNAGIDWTCSVTGEEASGDQQACCRAVDRLVALRDSSTR